MASARSNYDPEKDKVLTEVGEVNSDDGDLLVRVMAYNGGSPKVAINRRFFTRKGEERTKSPGRLTEADLKGLIPLLSKAKKALSEATQEPEKPS